MVRHTTSEDEAEYEQADRVEWAFGTGTIGSGRMTGEVVEVGLSKFGYDDVMRVCSDASGDVVHIRPEDVTRRV